jgi:hypothetical protein
LILERLGDKTCGYGIFFDIGANSVELLSGPYEVIVAFVLPEGLAVFAE